MKQNSNSESWFLSSGFLKSVFTHRFIEQLWYGKHFFALLLLPVSWLYAFFILLRHFTYVSGILPVQRVPVPVIVVGNLTVGGTGKTPLIIWLAEYLREKGYKPGVISRGYGGIAKHWPQQVRRDSDPLFVGDEPVLISRRLDCPVVVSPNRYIAARELLEHTDCNVLLCDDGLQHLSLHRDIEIAVIDGNREFGNGHCLPAGPLREPISRLNSVDMVVCNGKDKKNQYKMEYLPLPLRSVEDEMKRCELDAFTGKIIHAVAGVGNPDRFFSRLRSKEIEFIKHVFPDHYQYQPGDLDFKDDLPVLMTEKDAVKCNSFAQGKNFWYLPVQAELSKAFEHRLTKLLEESVSG